MRSDQRCVYSAPGRAVEVPDIVCAVTLRPVSFVCFVCFVCVNLVCVFFVGF